VADAARSGPVETNRAEVVARRSQSRVAQATRCLRSLAGRAPTSGMASVEPVSSVCLLGRHMHS
jgi:hypothetical protein